MGRFVILVLLARTQRFRLRWGITATGLTLASGRGTFPAACLVGLWALLTGVAPGPSGPATTPMIVIGALAGAVYGLIPRHPRFGELRRPNLRRVVLCGVAGGAAMPPLAAFGHMPANTANAVGVVVLLGGWLGVLAYVLAQRRRAKEWGSAGYGLRTAAEPVVDPVRTCGATSLREAAPAPNRTP